MNRISEDYSDDEDGGCCGCFGGGDDDNRSTPLKSSRSTVVAKFGGMRRSMLGKTKQRMSSLIPRKSSLTFGHPPLHTAKSDLQQKLQGTVHSRDSWANQQAKMLERIVGRKSGIGLAISNMSGGAQMNRVRTQVQV
eukprot:CAMPEP_0174730754 /NCGR_PEP_ID=MMETSP1094-20130205/56233_1 /TAXON_ID=156173 /ORGANISM="Chrysochromulina brevifilum, Strain UTEX LB 985" /LENGTH=136 /DNA_ID=CAMNT_0015933051 /DNA_START=131 /DNA_END=541 /DNA_ORIENTATION=-